MIPTDIILDYEKQKKTFPWAWIGYNATTEMYFVSILPRTWSHSMFIVEN